MLGVAAAEPPTIEVQGDMVVVTAGDLHLVTAGDLHLTGPGRVSLQELSTTLATLQARVDSTLEPEIHQLHTRLDGVVTAVAAAQQSTTVATQVAVAAREAASSHEQQIHELHNLVTTV